ncbi:AAA family ATPase [Amycolatopsis sp. NPDC101161]|uniref:ATP-binding protein n=1 Tax=Amycolatopsis sp. NPDC101161 TaxID=3363940 RepID=UPI00382D5CE4
MSDAASGRKLPTRAVALAYVRACDGPVSAWDQRWHQAAKQLRRSVDEPPYRGLAAFGPGDTERFFGRETVVELLLTHLATERLVVLTGPSGSGKTSVLRAVQERLDHVVVVDPLEDVLALPAGERVVVGLRDDFLDALSRHPDLAAAPRVTLDPLTAEQVRAALGRPASDAGRALEHALLATLTAEVVRQPGALPFATEALRRTWRAGGLTLAGYDATGGIPAVLAGTAEAVYGRLAAAEQAMARDLFLRLVTFGEHTADTRRRLPRDELDAPAVAERFVRARLITADRTGLELAHDGLIDGWPRLRGWLTEDRAALGVHRRLTEATRLWEAAKLEPAALYRGVRLTEAVNWAQRPDARPNARERRFLDAGSRQRESELIASRRTAVRRRRLSATTAVSAVVAAASAVTAVLQHHRGRRSRISTKKQLRR